MLDNIENLDQILARRAEEDLALERKFTDRATAISDEQRRANEANERAERAARLAEAARRQRHFDLSQPRQEEAGQLADALSGNVPSTVPAPQPPVASPAQGGDTQQLPPVPPANNDNVGLGIMDPATPVTPAPQTPARTTVNIFNVHHWTRVQWFTAAIGLVVAFLVWLFTWYLLLGAGHIHGDGRAWTSLLWLLILLFTGLFAGGWIGSVIDERNEGGNQQNRQH